MSVATPRLQRLPITICVQNFEGPLDLLLHLIQEHELEISAVSIERVTDQYLHYLTRMEELDFDIASDFLVMAATLLFWKSRALLPGDPSEQTAGEEADALPSREELVRQLLEHQRYLAAGDDLAQLPRLHEDFFVRATVKLPVEKVWREMNLTDLSLSFQDAMMRSKKRYQILRKETVSIADKIKDFSKVLRVGEIIAFHDLITRGGGRGETVATFLSSLELARLKRLLIDQNEVYGPIYLKLLMSLEGFDATQASGFDQPEIPEVPTEISAV